MAKPHGQKLSLREFRLGGSRIDGGACRHARVARVLRATRQGGRRSTGEERGAVFGSDDSSLHGDQRRFERQKVCPRARAWFCRRYPSHSSCFRRRRRRARRGRPVGTYDGAFESDNSCGFIARRRRRALFQRIGWSTDEKCSHGVSRIERRERSRRVVGCGAGWRSNVRHPSKR